MTDKWTAGSSTEELYNGTNPSQEGGGKKKKKEKEKKDQKRTTVAPGKRENLKESPFF